MQIVTDQPSIPENRSESSRVLGFIRDMEPFFHRRWVVYVDVGAYKGTVFRHFTKSGLTIREAHLIEPNPESFAVLERTAANAEGVKLCACHHLALGADEGRLRLRAAERMTKVVAQAGDADEAGGYFEVAATTLDALSAGFERRHISILKIDVEGYEPEVLAGARGLLADQAIDVLYIEGGMRADSAHQSYYRTIEDLLAGHGYRLFRIYEQAHEWLDDSPLLRRINMAFMSERFAVSNPYRLSRELFELRRDRDVLEEHRRRLEGDVTRLKAALEAAQADKTRALQQAEAHRVSEAATTARLGAKIEAARAAATAAAGEAQGLQREAAELRGYGAHLEARHAALLASESWRLTEPVRRVIRLVTRRPPPKPFAPRLTSEVPSVGAPRPAKKGADEEV